MRTVGVWKNSALRSSSSASPEQFDEIDGLVIPGGESSTFLKLLGEKGFEKLDRLRAHQALVRHLCRSHPAGQERHNPDQPGLNALDMTIERNAYGRQIDSTIIEAVTALGGPPLEMVFIRAPRIEQVGDGVEVLAKRGDDPVLVRQGSVMAATFHPELSDDTRVHAEFLKLVKNGTA